MKRVWELLASYNNNTKTLTLLFSFTGLGSGTTTANLHGPAEESFNAPIQISFVGFPTGVTSGSYSNTYSISPEQEAQLVNGTWYINICTKAFPNGEIRGQITQSHIKMDNF
ncbi:MAG: CHRD domain-containing protein [Ignavibacteria bacterium]|nr:CHRD domain-containing protein [Ignavibacteria bacterium]